MLSAFSRTCDMLNAAAPENEPEKFALRTATPSDEDSECMDPESVEEPCDPRRAAAVRDPARECLRPMPGEFPLAPRRCFESTPRGICSVTFDDRGRVVISG